MDQLDQGDFAVAHSLFQSLSTVHLSLPAILGGVIEGDVWVDDPHRPTVALAAEGDAFYLAGTVNRRHIASIRALVPDWAYLFVEPAWEAHLAQFFNPFARPHPRRWFAWAHNAQPRPPVVLPAGFRLAAVDAALLDSDMAGLDGVLDTVDGWGDRSTFLASGVGYCVVHGDRIVSQSVSDSVVGGRCELGVGTDPEFRRMGLGRATAQASLQACRDRGITDIGWHCHASNAGSIAIARAIGLVEQGQYRAFSSALPAENAGDLDQATCRDWAVHLEQAGRTIGWHYFHAAGARTQAGDNQQALDNLQRLVDGGWDGDAAWLEDYWAVQTLTGDPRFLAIVAEQRRRNA